MARGMKLPFRQRINLFEFGDQSWLSGWLRDAYLDCLNLGLKSGGQFNQLHRAYANWSAVQPGASVLDLGSGGAGPIATMVRRAKRESIPLPKIILSDLHPSPEHYQVLQSELGAEQIGYMAEPVSALAVGPGAPRLRSMCSTLHHFAPTQVQALILDAIHHADGLFIVEPLQRNLRHFLMVLLSGPLPYLLAPFFARTWSWRKFFFTTILPIAPLMVAFDGCVSVLRTYKPEELVAMIPEPRRHQFTIQTGFLPYMGCFAAYFVAIQRNPAASSDPHT